MDYRRFCEKLPQLYDEWGQESVNSKSNNFQQVLNQVKGMITANAMQLLNFAVECMEPNEIYCEIGCYQGASLIGALLNHPTQLAYVVDNFSEFDPFGENFDKFTENISKFQLEEQILFCQQDFMEFFFDLGTVDKLDKVGLYFYDGASDYRSVLMSLLLVKPFLANKSLIVLANSNWPAVRQASLDFVATHNQCQALLNLTPKEKYADSPFGKGLQILSWDVEQINNYSYSNYQDACHQEFVESIRQLQTKEKAILIENLHEQAIELHHSAGILIAKKESLADKSNEQAIEAALKSLKEAEKKYKEVLLWNRKNAVAWSNLGMVYYMTERYQDATDMLLTSLELDSSRAVQYYNLGLVFEKIGEPNQAIQYYKSAIAIDPKFLDAYNNIGNICLHFQGFTEAEAVYRQAIAANPEHFGSYVNIGNLMIELQQVDEAIANYETALKLKPQDPDILHNLGIALELKDDKAQAALYFAYSYYRQAKYEEAIAEYQKFLATQTGEIELYFALGDCYRSLSKYEEAIKVYQEGINLYPNSAELYFEWVLVLQNSGQTQEAIALARVASEILKNDLSLKREEQLLLPVLYESQEEIKFYRERYIQGLEEFIRQTSLETPESRKSALLGISRYTNFYLQYQGYNDLVLQKQYGQLVHNIMAANYPQWVEPRPMPPIKQNGKIRIGYVSACMRGHTVGKLSLGWLRNCDHQRFEVYSYYINRQQDSFTQKFRVYSDAFHHIPDDLEKLCEQIISDELHVLVFFEIGMYSPMTKTAALRLAPVQCTTWGHPVTTGLPTVDYFLSSDLMEPDNAETHYSEHLIRLPNIGVSYAKPVIPDLTNTRSNFQLRDDAVVYLSCQSLYKYLPQHDYIFAEIARQVPQAQFVFLSSPSAHLTEKFRQRLKRTFANYCLDSEDYCVILPRQNQTNYWNVNRLSDVFLDTLTWSGGNTTLEAIACNLPVVTYPGEFMRGRHSYGILKTLGVTDTIASNEAEYIEIAVKLGLSPEWRNSAVQQMLQRHAYLYDDKTCVIGLEEFYRRITEERQSNII